MSSNLERASVVPTNGHRRAITVALDEKPYRDMARNTKVTKNEVPTRVLETLATIAGNRAELAFDTAATTADLLYPFSNREALYDAVSAAVKRPKGRQIGHIIDMAVGVAETLSHPPANPIWITNTPTLREAGGRPMGIGKTELEGQRDLNQGRNDIFDMLGIGVGSRPEPRTVTPRDFPPEHALIETPTNVGVTLVTFRAFTEESYGLK